MPGALFMKEEEMLEVSHDFDALLQIMSISLDTLLGLHLKPYFSYMLMP